MRFMIIAIVATIAAVAMSQPVMADDTTNQCTVVDANEARALFTLTTEADAVPPATEPAVAPPETYGYVQWKHDDASDEIRFRRARIYLDAPMANDFKLQAVLQRVGGKNGWAELNLSHHSSHWDQAFGISTTAIGYSVPAPHTWPLITYPAATNLPYTAGGIFLRADVGTGGELRFGALNGQNDLDSLQPQAWSARLEAKGSDGNIAVSNYQGEYEDVHRQTLTFDGHTNLAKHVGFDGFYALENGDEGFRGGYGLLSIGDQTKLLLEADYFRSDMAAGDWSYAIGGIHDFRTNTHKTTSLRMEWRRSGEEDKLSAILQVAVN